MSVEAKFEILELLAVYAHTLDSGDNDGWVRLFTEDAVWESYVPGETKPSLHWEGHEGITQFAAQMTRNQAGTQIRHMKMNTIFDEVTATSAKVRSYGLLVATPKGEAPRVALTGIYVEELVKTTAGWRIRHCVLHIDR